MIKEEVLKDIQFERVAETRVDSKHRVGLGRNLSGEVTSFQVYRNAHGQIVLDPMVSIPAHEAWLFKNKKALASVRQGLKEAKQGKLIKAKEDFSKYPKDKD